MARGKRKPGRRATSRSRSKRRRRTRQPRPMKIAALIASAIRDLRETKGSTPRKIIGYISYASNMPEGRVRRQVKAALKRGVEYGILKRYRGHYFLPTGGEMDRANRIAVRFARLPTPTPQLGKSKIIAARRTTPARESRRPRILAARSRGPRKLGRSRSLPFSASASLLDKIDTDDLSTDGRAE